MYLSREARHGTRVCPFARSYQVYLQLKKDMLEGRLLAPLQTAAVLCSYILQGATRLPHDAEFPPYAHEYMYPYI